MIEAMKQALEALENIMLERDLDSATTIARNARYGLRQAIVEAQKQEQDTLAYREAANLAKWLFKKHYAHEEHYASGRVVWNLCDTTAGVITQIDNMVCQLVKAEKHEVSQEPVMGVEVKLIASGGFVGNVWWIHENLQEGVFHLYTHPQPKREWVGLTDEQIHIRYKAMRGDKSPRYIEIYRDCENAHGIKGK